MGEWDVGVHVLLKCGVAFISPRDPKLDSYLASTHARR